MWRSDAYDDVLALAEVLGMQVIQGLSPYTDFPTGHPLYIGQSDRSFGGFRSLNGADVLLNMGGQMLYQEGAAPIVSPDWTVIEIRSVPNDVARYNADALPIVADVKESAKALVEAVTAGIDSELRREGGQSAFDESAAFTPELDEARAQIAAGQLDPGPDRLGARRAGSAIGSLENDAIINHEFNSAMPRVMPWLEFGRGKKELFGRTRRIGARLVGRRLGRHQDGEARPADRVPHRRRRFPHGPGRGAVGGAPLRGAGALHRVQQPQLQRHAHARLGGGAAAARAQARPRQLSRQSRM